MEINQDQKVVLYDTEQVANLFQVDKYTVRRWITEGKLVGIKFGRKWLFEEKYILEKLNIKTEGGE